jgi:hypothetical protein
LLLLLLVVPMPLLVLMPLLGRLTGGYCGGVCGLKPLERRVAGFGRRTKDPRLPCFVS